MFFQHNISSFIYSLSRFSLQCHNVINTFHTNYVGVQCIGWSSFTVNTILWYNVPVHHFLDRTLFPVSDLLYSFLWVFSSAVSRQCICTSKSQADSPIFSKCPEIPAIACCAVVCQDLFGWVPFKKLLWDIKLQQQNLLTLRLPNGKLGSRQQESNYEGQEMGASIMGDVHPQSLPCTCCPQLPPLSLDRCWINWWTLVLVWPHKGNVHQQSKLD